MDWEVKGIVSMLATVNMFHAFDMGLKLSTYNYGNTTECRTTCNDGFAIAYYCHNPRKTHATMVI